MPSTIKIKITKTLLLLCFFIRIVLLEYLETLAMILKETFGCKLKSLNNDVHVTWYSSIKCYHRNIKIKENVPCVSNNVKNIIFHALSWKVKKKHGQLWRQKILEIEPGSIAWILFQSYYLILLFRKIAWTCCGGYEWMRKTWSTHKVFRIYLDLKILKNSSSTTLNV